MSSKPSTSKKEKEDPSFRSSRRKTVVLNTRQLRKKEGSIKKISEITQMLLTPINEKMPRAQNKANKKSPKEKQDSEKVDVEKVKLVKKKVLVVAQKVPKRGRKRKVDASPERIPECPKKPVRSKEKMMTVEELIRLHDEDSLDDEEFMAILTCPSPVWWEDPPHNGYSEEPIFSQSSYAEHYEDLIKCNPLQNDITNNTLKIPENKKCDIKFMTKRCKLENLLGNIKNKASVDGNAVKELKTNDISKELTDTIKNKNENNIVEAEDDTVDSKAEDTDEEKLTFRSKKTSESTEGDSFLGFPNDELLNDLENMEIPIKTEDSNSDDYSQVEENVGPVSLLRIKSKGARSEQNNFTEKRSLIELDEIDIIDNSAIDTISINSINSNNSDKNDEKCENKGNLSIVSIEPVSSSVEENAVGSSPVANAPCNAVLELNSNDNSNNSSPQNSEDENCIRSVNKMEGNESENKQDNVSKVINDVEKKEVDSHDENRNSISKKLNKEQLVAVYKIITDDNFKLNHDANKKISTENIITEPEKNTENSNLATYYKKCKYTKRAKIEAHEARDSADNDHEPDAETTVEQTNKDNEQILHKPKETACKKCEKNIEESSYLDNNKINFNVIPDGKSAKYCLKCSSIFETETCCYCAKQNKGSEQSHCQTCKTIN